MQTLTSASRELFRRSADEQFDSLDSLYQRAQDDARRGEDRWHSPSEIRPTAAEGRLDLELGTLGSYRLNDWSFSQICKLAGVSKETLNKLQPETAGRALIETLPVGAKPLQVLSFDRTVRSIHGASYTRLHNLDLLTVTVMPTIDIDSGALLTDIEHHFRVTAGPGAGKTYWLVNHMAMSIALAKRGLFDIAIQSLVRGICLRHGFRRPFDYDGIADIIAKRSLALFLLEKAMQQQKQLLGKTALDFYNLLQEETPKCDSKIKLPKVKQGKFHVAASTCSCVSLFDALRTREPIGTSRVVHQAKGAEADAVFVILDKEQLDHILTPAPNDEEQRIIYVALSRARDNLSLFCPKTERLSEFAKLPNCATTVVAPPA